jgi:hypothetical protein
MKYKKNERKSDTSTVGDAINDLLDNYHLKQKFNEKRLIESWNTLMGTTIANRTSKIYINNKILFVQLTSAPLKNELNMSKEKVMSIFTNEIGKGIISDIIFL